MKRHLIMLLVIASVFSVTGLLLAEEQEEINNTWGVVCNISENQITITEYDYDNYLEADVIYTVDADTRFENAGSLGDIKLNDSVVIEFVVRADGRIARLISVEGSYYIDDTAEDYSLEELEEEAEDWSDEFEEEEVKY